MRNALICAAVMLAIVLVWPLVFGVAGGSQAKASQTGHVASTTKMTIPPAQAWRRPPVRKPTVAGGTCFRHYQAAFDSCPESGAACHRQSFDDWDVCEATGFWPE